MTDFGEEVGDVGLRGDGVRDWMEEAWSMRRLGSFSVCVVSIISIMCRC